MKIFFFTLSPGEDRALLLQLKGERKLIDSNESFEFLSQRVMHKYILCARP